MKFRGTAILSVALGLMLAGCGKHDLRPDPVNPPPIKAGYPTAEVRACGKDPDELGLVVCPVVKGQPFASVDAQVMGYNRGTVKVAGNACGIDTEVTYEGTGLVKIPLEGIADRSCLISVTVSPKFPNEDQSSLKIESLRGHIALRMINEGDDWQGESHKITSNFSSKLKLFVSDDDEVRVIAEGCGNKGFDKKLKSKLGYVDLELGELVPAEPVIQTCMIEGAVISPQYKDLLFNVAMSKFDPKFTPLPVPSVAVKGGKLTVTADNSVSIISLNGDYQLAKSGTFSFDSKVKNTLRLLTVAGRSVLGTWKPEKQEWEWRN